MRTIIMAAGKGTRISRHIYENPKCTLDIGGVSLIQNTVELLTRNRVSEIALVVGYRYRTIQQCLEGHGVKYYYNPFYDRTNSIASLWFAREFLKDDEDLMLFNGDVFFEQNIFDQVLKEQKDLVVFSDETRKEEGDYKLHYDHGKLIAHGKNLQNPSITGEYVGIGKVGKAFIKQFVERLNAMVFNQQNDAWWEDVVFSFIGETGVHVKDVDKCFWAEIDFIEDYQRILHFKRNARL